MQRAYVFVVFFVLLKWLKTWALLSLTAQWPSPQRTLGQLQGD